MDGGTRTSHPCLVGGREVDRRKRSREAEVVVLYRTQYVEQQRKKKRWILSCCLGEMGFLLVGGRPGGW